MKTKAESMKRNFILFVFCLPLLISPYGGADLFMPWTKVVAQESYHAAKNLGHTSVLTMKSVLNGR